MILYWMSLKTNLKLPFLKKHFSNFCFSHPFHNFLQVALLLLLSLFERTRNLGILDFILFNLFCV